MTTDLDEKLSLGLKKLEEFPKTILFNISTLEKHEQSINSNSSSNPYNSVSIQQSKEIKFIKEVNSLLKEWINLLIQEAKKINPNCNVRDLKESFTEMHVLSLQDIIQNVLKEEMIFNILNASMMILDSIRNIKFNLSSDLSHFENKPITHDNLYLTLLRNFLRYFYTNILIANHMQITSNNSGLLFEERFNELYENYKNNFNQVLILYNKDDLNKFNFIFYLKGISLDKDRTTPLWRAQNRNNDPSTSQESHNLQQTNDFSSKKVSDYNEFTSNTELNNELNNEESDEELELSITDRQQTSRFNISGWLTIFPIFSCCRKQHMQVGEEAPQLEVFEQSSPPN